MVVGICRFRLSLQDHGSLKDKRRMVRPIIDRLRARFNLAVAEVADLDDRKRATIALSVISNCASHVDSMLDTILRAVDLFSAGTAMEVERELINYGDEKAFSTSLELDLPPS